ncbi:hypothetical protein HYDPIDRAFT_28574 [Hydnomerulius pinastri MD-312]|uniref:Cerato-platanin n=1 Tax=Hydnomerulius pinastri MD-312 TaxID=994086 RepID=A0A0C9W1B2_9AGAM|nr:hypothetical protein HYDPIDRAFT_28574 [Hydnomerulius pinastri MD-312]
MKFATVFASLAVFALPIFAETVEVTYNTNYDDASFPLSSTACSNGVNGLESKYPTLGSIPNFPNVGGIPGLVWNSTLCGTCWTLTYTEESGSTNEIFIFAVDESYTFDISLSAMNLLTGGIAVEKGTVNATAAQWLTNVDCGSFPN